MTVRNIPRELWQDELDSFSRQHEGWIVSITTRNPDGRVAVAAHDLPLQGINPASPQMHDIAIGVGDGSNRLTHHVHDPTAVSVDLTAARAERALVIDGRDGVTRVEFRSPMRPEEVDGLPAMDDE